MRRSLFQRRHASFTLVELLTAIAIIAILAGLTLAAASGVMKSAARSRAHSEIQAMSTALESYKTDNGTYPDSSSSGLIPSAGTYPSTVNTTAYTDASEILFQALFGRTNYASPPSITDGKNYMTFKTSQLGNYKGSEETYIQDPFGNPYGYYATSSTADATAPINGVGFFDLWSTGGLTQDPKGAPAGSAVNAWVNNWSAD